MYLIESGAILLQYLTFEAFLLTAIYFSLSFICYFDQRLKKLCAILFETIWSVNCVVTLAYWSYLSDYSYRVDEVMTSIIPHSAPFLMTLIDFILNEINFYRPHYFLVIGYLIFYSVCILLPCTLTVGIVYHGITFANWFSYVFLIGFILFGLAMLEIGKIIKEKCTCCRRKTSQIENNLRHSLSN